MLPPKVIRGLWFKWPEYIYYLLLWPLHTQALWILWVCNGCSWNNCDSLIIMHMYSHQIHLNVVAHVKYTGYACAFSDACKNVHALPVMNAAEIQAFKEIKNNYSIQQWASDAPEYNLFKAWQISRWHRRNFWKLTLHQREGECCGRKAVTQCHLLTTPPSLTSNTSRYWFLSICPSKTIRNYRKSPRNQTVAQNCEITHIFLQHHSFQKSACLTPSVTRAVNDSQKLPVHRSLQGFTSAISPTWF